MIKTSPELAAIASRWLNALKNRERATLTNLFSASEHTSYIGSSFDEFWSGKMLRDGYADHIDEIPDFAIKNFDVEAFESNNFGWASWIGELHFHETGNVVIERFTWVFVLEDGTWKIAHVHVSNPTSNIDNIGIEHRAFDDLIRAAKEGYNQIPGEGTATVMFTDIADSSSITNSVGDRAWAKAINEHFEAVTEVIEENGGNLVKTLGDGTMSTFSTARNAMITAKNIQNLEADEIDTLVLKVRIGIHTGDIIQSNGDFFGTVVNKAARIASSASPGQILVSDATRSMVEGSVEFTFESPITVALRGIEGNHSISTLSPI